MNPTTFLSPFPSQPNSGKCHFSPYFSLIIFHHPCFTPTKYTLRAITSDCINFCKIEKCSLFTHFGPKNTHISGCKIVHLCTIATVTVHICTIIVALLFIILYIVSLSSIISHLIISPLSFDLSLPLPS